nr:hypothetical protein GCM10020092_100170 [Actinoplanes digitatis]
MVSAAKSTAMTAAGGVATQEHRAGPQNVSAGSSASVTAAPIVARPPAMPTGATQRPTASSSTSTSSAVPAAA